MQKKQIKENRMHSTLYPGCESLATEMKGKQGRGRGRRKKGLSFLLYFFLYFLALVPRISILMHNEQNRVSNHDRQQRKDIRMQLD